MKKPDPELVRFGKALRAQRQLLRYRQNEIARMVGINSRTIANIEWARHWPSMIVYIKLCEVLKLPTPPLIQRNELANKNT